MKTELVLSNEPWKKCVKEGNPFPACAEIMAVAANLELSVALIAFFFFASINIGLDAFGV